MHCPHILLRVVQDEYVWDIMSNKCFPLHLFPQLFPSVCSLLYANVHVSDRLYKDTHIIFNPFWNKIPLNSNHTSNCMKDRGILMIFLEKITFCRQQTLKIHVYRVFSSVEELKEWCLLSLQIDMYGERLHLYTILEQA